MFGWWKRRRERERERERSWRALTAAMEHPGTNGPPGEEMAARREKGTEVLRAALARLAAPADRLDLRRLRPGEVLPVTATRFGGAPYAERGETWPLEPKTREPLEFVFQLNARDLPHHPRPELGLICVFASRHAMDRAYAEHEESLVARVYPHADEAAYVPLPRSSSAPAPRVVPCAVSVSTVSTVPEMSALQSLEPGVAREATKDEEAWWSTSTVWHAATNRLGVDLECSRVGGWPYGVQMTPSREAFVAQVMGEEVAGIEWGDAGDCYVLFDPETGRVSLAVQGY